MFGVCVVDGAIYGSAVRFVGVGTGGTMGDWDGSEGIVCRKKARLFLSQYQGAGIVRRELKV